jgi:hypothetical protein
LVDTVEVDLAVEIAEVVSGLEGVLLGADTTLTVNTWESDALDDFKVASIVIRISDGWISKGTSPLRFRLWLLNDSHGVNGSSCSETVTSEALEKREPTLQEKGIPIVAFTDPTVSRNSDKVISTYTMALAISP